MSEVILHVDAKPYGGWMSIDIDRSIEACAGAFALTVTENWPGQQAVSAIQRGALCQLTIDGEVVITGDVNDTNPTYDEETHEVSIAGRDRSGDIVDCSAISPNFMFLNQTLLQIATALCHPFGIKVSADVDVGAPIPAFRINVGEKVFEAIERVARHRGVLLVADGHGGLLITRPGNQGYSSVLRLGVNIKRAAGKMSDRGRFSHYIVLAQSTGSDNIAAEISAGIAAEVFDPGVARYRPLIIICEEPLSDLPSLRMRALWEATVRQARGRRCDYEVQGWRDAGGTLWQPNRFVMVDDDFSGLHEQMLISRVRLLLDEAGEIAVLTVVGARAFDPVPLPAIADVDLAR